MRPPPRFRCLRANTDPSRSDGSGDGRQRMPGHFCSGKRMSWVVYTIPIWSFSPFA